MRVLAYFARNYNSAAEATSLLDLSSVASLTINVMFVLVSKFKMIGMLLNVVHGPKSKKASYAYNKEF